MLRRTLGLVVRHKFPLRQYSHAAHSPPESHVELKSDVEPKTLDSVSDIIAAYRAACPHPVFALTAPEFAATEPAATTIEDALQAAGIARDEYDTWKPVISASTLSSALDAANSVLALDNPSSLRPFPTWVLLNLLSNKPASRMEASVAYRLALSQPVDPSQELTPPLLILVAYWLAHFGMLGPLHRTILHLTRTCPDILPEHISLLLRILVAHAPQGTELQAELSILLKFAIRHRLPLSPLTYRTILDDHTTSPTVANLVEVHMKTCGFTPNYVHTRALLRIYGQGGQQGRAADSWRRIRYGELHGPPPSYISRKDFKLRMLEDYLKSFKKTGDINQYLKYLSEVTACAQERRTTSYYVSEPASAKPTLPTSDNFHPSIWLQVIRTAAQDPETPPNVLLSVYDEGRQHISDPSVVHFATFLLIKGLMRRRSLKEIVPLLADVMPHKDNFSTSQLTIVVEAMTMLGRPDAAFHLMRQSLARTIKTSSGTAVPLIDTQMINTFMIGLLRIGRPDAVFYIWDTMPRIFGVEPSAVSFAIVLKAARVARKCEGTLQVALEDFGLRHILPSSVASSELERAPQKLDREQAIEGLERMLKPDLDRAMTGFWRGQRAGTVALRTARQIILSNWPELASLKSPVPAARKNASAQAVAPMSDLYRSILHPDNEFLGQDLLESASTGTPQEGGATPYYTILPHDPMFRALMDLLADEERTWHVPLILKWMRYLAVGPSKTTLATALVYWAEVSLDGPWIEKMKGTESNRYMMLVRWLTDWVGPQRMPQRADMQMALQRVQYCRDMRELGAPPKDIEVDVDAWLE
ncbi:hypothetical protein ONZ51_g9182 [Trametes cubensis]|uniref:Uncharacterized protein n=1 Tax=Trametes cubensis TaxID=1111947 RepID=A0AAD7TLU7_9APHY|nr:hypothetical protein ONZ51_g9182 [Trametes cubensis]